MLAYVAYTSPGCIGSISIFGLTPSGNTIKAAEVRISEISDQATAEALTLAPNGGEFTDEGHTFQLQLTEVIDMSNHHRYKDEVR